MYYTGTSKLTHLYECTIIFQQKRCLSEKTKISEIKCSSSISKRIHKTPDIRIVSKKKKKGTVKRNTLVPIQFTNQTGEWRRD